MAGAETSGADQVKGVAFNMSGEVNVLSDVEAVKYGSEIGDSVASGGIDMNIEVAEQK